MADKTDGVESRLDNIEAELRRIRSLYERTMSYRQNDPETALMHARKAAEAICRQLFARVYGSNPGTLTLDGLIEKLNARSALPRAISVPMRTIQGYGNFAAHEQDGSAPDSITPDYIQPCLQALATVVDWYFAESVRLPIRQDAAAPSGNQIATASSGDRSTESGRVEPAPSGAVRLGDLARTLGLSDAAAIRLARERLNLELRTPSALLSAEQVAAMIEAASGAKSATTVPAVKTLNLGNDIEISFALIPTGAFRMGSPQEEDGHNDDEIIHDVRISRAFYLSRFPVTQAQYENVAGNNPSYFQGSDLPVEMVSWFDAVAFCELLSERLGREVRLPTEAEWKYACRAGTSTAFSCGSTITTDQANFDGKFTYGAGAQGTTRRTTTSVDAFPPNAWGLYDMHGNVWEWCADWYGNYARNAVTDPTGPSSGDIRILRGGSWFHSPADARSAQRDALDPGRRHSIYGFRVVLVAG